MVTALSPRRQPAPLPALARAGPLARGFSAGTDLAGTRTSWGQGCACPARWHREVGLITCAGSAVQPLWCALRAFVISCCFANCRVLCGSRGRAVAPLLSPRPAVPAGCVRTERLGPGAGDRLKFGRFRAVSAGLPARGLWGFSAPALDPLTRSSCTWRPLAVPPRHRWLSLPAQPEVPWNRGDSFQDAAEQLWPRELRPQQRAGPGDTCISPCCSFPR